MKVRKFMKENTDINNRRESFLAVRPVKLLLTLYPLIIWGCIKGGTWIANELKLTLDPHDFPKSHIPLFETALSYLRPERLNDISFLTITILCCLSGLLVKFISLCKENLR